MKQSLGKKEAACCMITLKVCSLQSWNLTSRTSDASSTSHVCSLREKMVATVLAGMCYDSTVSFYWCRVSEAHNWRRIKPIFNGPHSIQLDILWAGLNKIKTQAVRPKIKKREKHHIYNWMLPYKSISF